MTGQLDWGGAERQLYLLAAGLKRRGSDVRVCCLSTRVAPYGVRLAAEAVPLDVVERKGAWDLARMSCIRRWLRDNALDAVCSFGEFPAVYVALAELGRRRRHANVAMLRRSALRLGPVRRLFVRLAFRASDSVIANSEAGIEYGVRSLGLRRDRLSILPNALPDDLLDSPMSRRDAREKLGLPSDVPLVAYVGRMSHAKDIPTLVAALAELRRGPSPPQCLIVGQGLHAPPAGMANPGSHVTWLGPREDAKDIIAAADVLLLTSRSEGTPNVVLEGMALGTPVVSTAVGDVPRLLASGRGRTAPPGDVEALARAVRDLLVAPAARAELAVAAREHVLAEFGLDRALARFETLIEAAIGRCSPRTRSNSGLR